jgi:hypothetical protein
VKKPPCSRDQRTSSRAVLTLVEGGAPAGAEALERAREVAVDEPPAHRGLAPFGQEDARRGGIGGQHVGAPLDPLRETARDRKALARVADGRREVVRQGAAADSARAPRTSQCGAPGTVTVAGTTLAQRDRVETARPEPVKRRPARGLRRRVEARAPRRRAPRG